MKKGLIRITAVVLFTGITVMNFVSSKGLDTGNVTVESLVQQASADTEVNSKDYPYLKLTYLCTSSVGLSRACTNSFTYDDCAAPIDCYLKYQ
ncbi:hypothetical protein EYV94_11505 [Puteibacter caeruleilacunae]|nr:hypothetical protein EYV94_11505 [Puteibacter caeruleilacunae]